MPICPHFTGSLIATSLTLGKPAPSICPLFGSPGKASPWAAPPSFLAFRPRGALFFRGLLLPGIHAAPGQKFPRIHRHVPQCLLDTHLQYGTAVGVSAGGIVEEPAGRVNHHVAAGHEVIVLGDDGDAVLLNFPVGLDVCPELLRGNEMATDPGAVLPSQPAGPGAASSVRAGPG